MALRIPHVLPPNICENSFDITEITVLNQQSLELVMYYIVCQYTIDWEILVLKSCVKIFHSVWFLRLHQSDSLILVVNIFWVKFCAWLRTYFYSTWLTVYRRTYFRFTAKFLFDVIRYISHGISKESQRRKLNRRRYFNNPIYGI